MESTKSVQYYEDKLIEYDLTMDLALENLKKSYPLYKIRLYRKKWHDFSLQILQERF